MDLIALVTHNKEGEEAFLSQPHLPSGLPIHVFRLPIPLSYGGEHQHVLRSLLHMYPGLRSVFVIDEHCRVYPNRTGVLNACSRYIAEHDDWDLFFLEHIPLSRHNAISDDVCECAVPLGTHAVVYHQRVIREVLSWNLGLTSLVARLALSLEWRKLVSREVVFHPPETNIFQTLRAAWPFVIGLPDARTNDHLAFVDDLVRCIGNQPMIFYTAWLLFVAATIGVPISYLIIKATQ